MKRNWVFASLLACLLAFVTVYTVLARSDDPSNTVYRLRIDNRTEQAVVIQLSGVDVSNVYQLYVPAGSLGSFSIQGGNYRQLTHACGASAAGFLKVTRQLRLVFTSCFSPAANAGDPSLEKVHLTDAPSGLAWYYRYGGSFPGAAVPQGGVAGGRCVLNAVSDVTIYQRPSTSADVFSVQPAGFTQEFGDRTADGWLGFDPGVAQAANIGSFRLRWIPPNTPGLSGNCANLRVVWAPPVGICFDQTMTEGTKVYASPDTGSEVLATLNVGDFAAINGLTADEEWAQVDLGPGNTGSTAVGWVDRNTLNVNGPCDNLPTINP